MNFILQYDAPFLLLQQVLAVTLISWSASSPLSKVSGCALCHSGSWFSDQRWNPGPLQCKHGVLTTELPGKSPIWLLGGKKLSGDLAKNTNSRAPLSQILIHYVWWYFYKTQVVKNLPANAENLRHGLDPWVGKMPWRREWLPTPVLLPGESWQATVQRITKSWTRLKSFSTSNIN